MHPRANRFLDIEARVDDSSYSDEDDELDYGDPFIDRTANEDDMEDFYHSLRRSERADDDEIDLVWGELLSRACSGASDRRSQCSYAYADETLVRQRGDDDHPLWRIECKVGSEDDIVASLLLLAGKSHELLSAFTRGSIRGSVYLECRMNQNLVRLLQTIPGIKRTYQGVIRREIDPNDYPALLRMQSAQTSAGVGTWVRVTKGLYGGDVGLVIAIYSWGVDVLLIPRLDYSPQVKQQKRKASPIKPIPKSFDLHMYEQSSTRKAVRRPDGSYSLGRLVIVSGLLLKSCDYHSISSPVHDIPWSTYSLFAQSSHPDVNMERMPRPSEWNFKEGDWVAIQPSGKCGAVKSLLGDYVEVDTEEGLHRVPWQEVHKVVHVGDFVTWEGIETGGWVVEVKDDIAVIVIKVADDENKAHQDTGGSQTSSTVQSTEVHVNCLSICKTAFHFAPQPKSLQMPQQRHVRHPWCGSHVIISKDKHPRKGETGEIVDVLFNQKTSTGMALTIQLTRFDPVAPFKKIWIDCNDVSEYTTGVIVADLYSANKSLPRATPYFTAGNATSDTSSMTTPTWSAQSPNPQLHSPSFFEQLLRKYPLPSTPKQLQKQPSPSPTPKHVLLCTALLGAKVNVHVNGGQYSNQDLVVIVSRNNEDLVLIHNHYRKYHILEPQWVTLKHPHPTHDNGLLIVIEGDHCGSYVRRFHHRRTASGYAMVVAVVKTEEGARDTLTGEHLLLKPQSLCTVPESKGNKVLNKNIMKALRESCHQTNIFQDGL